MRQITTNALIEMAHSKDAPGHWALALHLEQAACDPNVRRFGVPLLHGTLKTMIERRYVDRSEAPTQVYPLTLDGDWPEVDAQVNGRELLAARLVAGGADPWVRDEEGLDALDWAVRARNGALFDQLLRHPNCPERDTLWKRTAPTEQRSLPWVHVAVNQSDWRFLDALIHAGAPVDARDTVGWLPAAWARHAQGIQALSERRMLPQDDGNRLATQKAWGRRMALNIVEGTLPLDAMTRAWNDVSPQSAKLQKTATWSRHIESWLAHKPLSDRPPPADFPGEGDEEAFAFRQSGSRGVAKGTWSLPGARLYALLASDAAAWQRYGGSKPLDWLTQLDAWWQGADDSMVMAWLDEPIRPGLSNRGLVAVAALLKDATAAARPNAPFVEGATSLSRMEALLNQAPETSFHAAVDAQRALVAGSKTSTERRRLYAQQWSLVLQSLGKLNPTPLASIGADAPDAWARVLEGVENGQQHALSFEAVDNLMRRVHHALETRPTAEAFALGRTLARWSSARMPGAHSDNDKHKLLSCSIQRAHLLESLAAAHRAQPDLGDWFDDPPFNDHDLKLLATKPLLLMQVQTIQATHLLEQALPDEVSPQGRRHRL